MIERSVKKWEDQYQQAMNSEANREYLKIEWERINIIIVASYIMSCGVIDWSLEENVGMWHSSTVLMVLVTHLKQFSTPIDATIGFSSPARMEFCPRFNLVIMPLYATTHEQICLASRHVRHTKNCL